MMNNILITGANGFLGSIIKDQLSNVITLGRDSKNDVICDLSAVMPHLTGEYKTVVHVAGKAHLNPRTKQEKELFFKVNLEGTKNLCKALSELKNLPKSFVFISTVSVYGLEEGMGIDEDYPLNGDSPYAQSKIQAEYFLQDWAQKNEVLLSILRLPLIAGPNAPGNLGAMLKGIASGKYLSIGKADSRKSIVLAKDIAVIIPIVAEIGGIYNLTDGYHPSFRELEDAISNKLRCSTPRSISLFVARILGRIGDVVGHRFPINSDKLKKITSTLIFDDARARNVLGWNPSIVINEIEKAL